jgi:hypothetical protein
MDWKLSKRIGKCVEKWSGASFMILYYKSSCMEEIIEVIKTCKSRQPGRARFEPMTS